MTQAKYKNSTAIRRAFTDPDEQVGQNVNDINWKNPDSDETELFIACQNGNTLAVERLLKHPEIDVNLPNRYGQTPFYAACDNNQLKVVELLAQDQRVNVTRKEVNRKTPFYRACAMGHDQVVSFLLKDPRIDPLGDTYKTPLWAACNNGHLSVVRLLLPRLGNWSQTEEAFASPFWIACLKNHTELIGFLLEHGKMNFNAEEQFGDSFIRSSAFCVASYNDDINLIKLLISDPRIDVMQEGSFGSPFGTACHRGNHRAVQCMLNHPRINVNTPDKQGQTPFWMACRGGHITIIKILLKDKRIDTAKPDKYGISPFIVACQMSHIKVIRLLIAFGIFEEREAPFLDDKTNDLIKSYKQNPSEFLLMAQKEFSHKGTNF